MTINQTLSQLKELNLIGMHEALANQLNNTSLSKLPFNERLSQLVENEISVRSNKRFQRLFKNSRIRYRDSS